MIFVLATQSLPDNRHNVCNATCERGESDTAAEHIENVLDQEEHRRSRASAARRSVGQLAFVLSTIRRSCVDEWSRRRYVQSKVEILISHIFVTLHTKNKDECFGLCLLFNYIPIIKCDKTDNNRQYRQRTKLVCIFIIYIFVTVNVFPCKCRT